MRDLKYSTGVRVEENIRDKIVLFSDRDLVGAYALIRVDKETVVLSSNSYTLYTGETIEEVFDWFLENYPNGNIKVIEKEDLENTSTDESHS